MTYQGMIAETITIKGHNGDDIEAYYSRPLGAGPVPGVVVIHHIFGLDDWSREVTRRLAYNGFAAISPNIYNRSPGANWEEQATAARAEGGIPDSQLVGDANAAADFLKTQPYANGKAGIIGFCSGGRFSFLVGCSSNQFDAVVNCWGGGVVVDDPTQLNEKRPVAAIDLTPNLSAPVLGLFGNEDGNPSPDHANRLEAKLKESNKTYEFHRYDGAGHGFFAVDRPQYRPEQATDGWKKVVDFYNKYLR